MNRQDLTLLTDFYELTMMQGYYEEKQNETVIFDVFFRQNPCGNGYSVCAGLEQVIDYVKNLNFTYEDVDYLRSLHIFSEDFLHYLSGFHFSGDIYAIPEGNRCISKRATVKSDCSDHGGTACRNRDPEHHQSPVTDRYEDFPNCLCGRRRRYYGIWSETCTRTGCRTLWCESCYDRRLRRHIQCSCRTAF